jgi:glucose-1-phosphate cytidylyltransferase
MKVLILAGGLGSRFGEETANKPKPMVEIEGKPILWHIMKCYSYYGFNDFILLLGYKGHVIEEYFKNNPEPDFNIKFLDTGVSSRKAQRIKYAENLIEEEYFFVSYGDDVSDVNPQEILESHKNNNKIVTLTAVPLWTSFGVVDINQQNEVMGFREKPFIDGYWINGGFFCFSKKIFSYLNDDEELEDEVFKKLSSIGEISAFTHRGFWKCMNTQKDKIELEELIKKNKAAWIKW